MKSVYLMVFIYGLIFVSLLPDETLGCQLNGRFDCCYTPTQKCCLTGNSLRRSCYNIYRGKYLFKSAKNQLIF